MSNDDTVTIKKLENYGFKITVLQAITLLSVLVTIGFWYKNKDEKDLIDGNKLNTKIDNVITFFRNSRAKDSIIYEQRRLIDSLALDKKLDSKFKILKSDIAADINRKFSGTEKRLNLVEKHISASYVEEVKKYGPNGPVSLKNVNK